MTSERLTEYVKSIAGCAFLAHMAISWWFIGIALRMPELIQHPLPYALPIGFAGAILGWWIVFKTEPTVYEYCPCCGTKVPKDVFE
jgi:hypothetical protein